MVVIYTEIVEPLI